MSSRGFISTLINHAKFSHGTCLRPLFQTSLTTYRQYSTEPAFRPRSKLNIGLINQKLNLNAKQYYQQTRETPSKWLFCILFAAGFAAFTSIFGVAHAQEDQPRISPVDLEKAQNLYASGLELMEQGKFQESINAFNAALALDPLESCIWDRRATAYLELKNFYQAINDYTMAINLSPQNGFYYLERGLAYHGSGNKNAMINDMRIAAKLGEPNAQAVLRANNW